MKGSSGIWVAIVIIAMALINPHFPILSYFFAMFLDGPRPQ